MYQIIDGAHLNSQEVNSTLNELKGLEVYQKLINTLSSESGLSLDDMKLRTNYQFNVVSDQNRVGNFYGKALTLTDPDEKVSVGYGDILYENNDLDDVVFLSGSILTEVKGKKIQRIFNVVDERIEIEEKERDSDFELKDSYLESDFPDNPNFKIGHYPSNDINTNAWYEFCAPGNYQHCGAGCGYNMPDGGGAPINSTDRCCVGHDNCWKAHGNWDPCCDKDFLSCLSGIYTAVAIAARGVFYFNSLKC